MLPSLFIAHGAPLLAVQTNEYTEFLSGLAHGLPQPKAIVLFSAHWESGVQQVGAAKRYETIYDFYGFPDELYQITYPASGSPALTAKIVSLLLSAGISCSRDGKRGLDHGAWIVLRLLYPQAQIPVVAMSVNPRLDPAEQYRLGQVLSALRQDDILLIASGGTVHNLGRLNWGTDRSDEWAVQFDDWLLEKLSAWELPALFQYETEAPHARLAVPPHGKEHFIPLFYAMGAADDVRKAELLHRSYAYGSLSQSVWSFG